MSPRNRCRRALGLFAGSPLAAFALIPATLGALIATGCTLNKDQFRVDKVFPRTGGSQGQIIQPNRCQLEIAIVTRPIRDKAINESVWGVADTQCIPEEARRSLEANGVRIGKITGALPPDLEAALKAPPPHKVLPVTLVPETNEAVPIRTAEIVPKLSLLTTIDNRAVAKDYELAAGVLRVTPSHDGERGVSLRTVPEIHHGPVKQGYQPLASSGAYPTNQLAITSSQQQDSLLGLASTLVVQPGDVAVLSCDVGRDRTLGSFLFTFVEANSDRKMQHLVLIWASRNKSGTIDADKLHVSADRPKESRETTPDSRDPAMPENTPEGTPKKDVGLKKDQPSAH